MRLPNVKSSVNLILGKAGWRIVKLDSPKTPIHFDMDEEFQRIYEKTRAHTMTTMANMYALYKAVQYIAKNKIPGDFVECGVWKGGSAMIAALTLLQTEDANRHLWLYDTYAGMTEPENRDVMGPDDSPVRNRWEQAEHNDGNLWNMVTLDKVEKSMFSTGYPQDKISFVTGKVEDTIPGNIPNEIALLRLDTDFYKSTYHELNYLFPRLSTNGVLIIDDYGYWKGSREATDEYFAENNIGILLHRIDPSSRVAVKTPTD